MGEERPTVAPGTEVCPACEAKLVPILYGLPSREGLDASERGEIAIGGCTVTGDDPQLACESCLERFWVGPV